MTEYYELGLKKMESQADPSKHPSETDKKLFEDIESRWERSVKGASSSRLSMS